MNDGVDRVSQQTEQHTKAYETIVESLDRETGESSNLGASREDLVIGKTSEINSENKIEPLRGEVSIPAKENENVDLQRSKANPTESPTDSTESTARGRRSFWRLGLFGRDRRN